MSHLGHGGHPEEPKSTRAIAFTATLHCLLGCSIGEILGMSLGAIFTWPDIETVIVSVILAFFFGYTLTIIPLLRAGLRFKKALPIAFASDTVSITIMEITDNAIMLAIPGAMSAHITSFLFWGSLAFSLLVAFAITLPVNILLISRGKGHAEAHAHHKS